jgi:hypothetical protein
MAAPVSAPGFPVRVWRHAGPAGILRSMKNNLAASLFILSLFAACSGSAASSVPGTYEVDKVALKSAMVAEMPAEHRTPEATKMMEGFVEGMSMTVELKADNTATMDMKGAIMGQPLDSSERGTWSLDGTRLSIKTKGKDGKEETKVADYANGSFTVEHDVSGKKMKMTFKKK